MLKFFKTSVENITAACLVTEAGVKEEVAVIAKIDAAIKCGLIGVISGKAEVDRWIVIRVDDFEKMNEYTTYDSKKEGVEAVKAVFNG